MGEAYVQTMLAPLAGFLFSVLAQASLGSTLNKKPLRLRRKGLDPVGVRGFEPPTSSSRTTRANRAALHPEVKGVKYRRIPRALQASKV